MFTFKYVMMIFANPDDTTPMEVLTLENEREVFNKVMQLTTDSNVPNGVWYTLDKVLV